MDAHLYTLYTFIFLTSYQVWRLSQQAQAMHERLLDIEKASKVDDEDADAFGADD